MLHAKGYEQYTGMYAHVQSLACTSMIWYVVYSIMYTVYVSAARIKPLKFVTSRLSVRRIHLIGCYTVPVGSLQLTLCMSARN